MSMYKLQMNNRIVVCTTNTVPGSQIIECLGLVHGTAMYGANFVKDFFARARDKIGGRVSSYEATMQGAHIAAVEEMVKEALGIRADAIVGMRLSIATCGQSMLMASVCGTAVRLKLQHD